MVMCESYNAKKNPGRGGGRVYRISAAKEAPGKIDLPGLGIECIHEAIDSLQELRIGNVDGIHCRFGNPQDGKVRRPMDVLVGCLDRRECVLVKYGIGISPLGRALRGIGQFLLQLINRLDHLLQLGGGATITQQSERVVHVLLIRFPDALLK